jgi:hypothetical protein
MTPKEKALTICANISLLGHKSEQDGFDLDLTTSIANLVVDEIIKSKPSEPKDYIDTIQYYIEVKQALEGI